MTFKWVKPIFSTKTFDSITGISTDNFLFHKVKGNLSLLMIQVIREDGKMVWCMDMEFTNGKMVLNMREIMWMAKSKEMESFITLQVNSISECGLTANSKALGK